MTGGVRDFDTCYYRRLITDAVRAVDAVRTLDGIDLDATGPPSTVFATRHAYGGPMDIKVRPFDGHGGGRGHHQVRRLARTRDRAGVAR